MGVRFFVLLLASVPLMAQSQTALPPDIDPVTLSRLPWATPQDLDEEGKQLLAKRPDQKPGPGPAHLTNYSPRERSLGTPTGVNSPVGARYFQLAVLIMAREIDQQYEWSAHEPAGLRQGLEQSVIDVVKYDRPATGIGEKDAMLINFCRGLLREHRISSELWASMVKEFGRQGTIEIMALMADYFTVGMMMNAADQHLPPDRKPLMPSLPPLTRK